MAVNADKPSRWKEDTARSVDLYNDWFMAFAPLTYRETRVIVTQRVEMALRQTSNLTDIKSSLLKLNPGVLPTLRMATAPPIARDRLIGLARVSPNLIEAMENQGRVPPRMAPAQLEAELQAIASVILKLADTDIFTWLATGSKPTDKEVTRAATIVADRLCGSQSDPIIRNAQEARQLTAIGRWLESRGYTPTSAAHVPRLDRMSPGTFLTHYSVPVAQAGRAKPVGMPLDVVVMPHGARPGDLPVLIEAKSAGDYTNTNKRRKEEATKSAQLRRQYGDGVCLVLFLSGYFDSGYLGYSAAEGLDWVWEHRIDDLAEFGI